MQRHSRSKGKQRLLGSHQKCWIWGRNAVIETLVAGRWPILDLYLSSALSPDQHGAAAALAAKLGLTPLTDDSDALTRLCHTAEHQGYLARMTDFPYSDEESVCTSLPPAPLCVILDGLQDPFNFGAIVRSAEVFGVDALFIAEAGQVGVTSMVVRSSAGAVNRLPIVRVMELEGMARRMKERGWCLMAASEKADTVLKNQDFTGGSVVIVGNEGIGIRPGLLALCDVRVRIPQVGRIGSLNAAAAASVFFYEARRQRDT
ncbi:MAG: TrmH family RNA methyltransferase [bacterium]